MKACQTSKNALNFVNLLTPGNFQEAENWLTPDCTYQYKDTTLKGNEIIQSFSDNHENASKKLDAITYLDGTVEKNEDARVFVMVKDKVSAKGQSYIYTDRLIISCNEKVGRSSIDRIEHAPVNGEREKLLAFFKSIGVDW